MKTKRHSNNNMSASLKVHTNSLRRLKNAKQNENDMLLLRNLELTENFQQCFSLRTELLDSDSKLHLIYTVYWRGLSFYGGRLIIYFCIVISK